jgi:hypothetical protein
MSDNFPLVFISLAFPPPTFMQGKTSRSPALRKHDVSREADMGTIALGTNLIQCRPALSNRKKPKAKIEESTGSISLTRHPDLRSCLHGLESPWECNQVKTWIWINLFLQAEYTYQRGNIL